MRKITHLIQSREFDFPIDSIFLSIVIDNHNRGHFPNVSERHLTSKVDWNGETFIKGTKKKKEKELLYVEIQATRSGITDGNSYR